MLRLQFQNQITVITGVSGSGKSSLAFDTIYEEGKRRYFENLGNGAKLSEQLQNRNLIYFRD